MGGRINSLPSFEFFSLISLALWFLLVLFYW